MACSAASSVSSVRHESAYKNVATNCTGMLISPQPDLLPHVFFDGEYISFDASLVIYINSTNIPQIMIINKIYENQNIPSL